jgi:hypothetical protein
MFYENNRELEKKEFLHKEGDFEVNISEVEKWQVVIKPRCEMENP